MQDQYLIFILSALRKYLYLVFPVITLFMGCKPVPADTAVNKGTDMTGKELFDYYGCKICHSLIGKKRCMGHH